MGINSHNTNDQAGSKLYDELEDLFKYIETSPLWETLEDVNNTTLKTSVNCARFTGYEADVFENKRFHELPMIEILYAKNVQKMDCFEFKINRTDGSFAWFKRFKSTMVLENGEKLNRITYIPITDYKEREVKLFETQERFKLLNELFSIVLTEDSFISIVKSALFKVNRLFPKVRIVYSTIDENKVLKILASNNFYGQLMDFNFQIDLENALRQYSPYDFFKPIIFNSIEKSELPPKLKNVIMERGVKAVLSKSFPISKTQYGIISFDTGEEHEWTDHEIKTIKNFTYILTIALKKINAEEEKKNLQEKLNEASERNTHLMDNLMGCIVVEDKLQNIQHVNKSFYANFNLKLNSKTDSFDLADKLGELAVNTETFKKSVKTIIIQQKVCRNMKLELNDGRTFEWDYLPIKIENYDYGRLWHFRDISFRVKAEKQLKEYTFELQQKKLELEGKAEELAMLNKKLQDSEQDLKKINKNKDKFLSIIAHDIRHPFSPIIGFTEILKEEADNLDAEEVKECATSINSAAKNLYKLVENLLQWTRLQSGRMEVEPEDTNVDESVSYVLEIFKNQISQKNIHVVKDFDEEISVYVDVNCLETVIRNLLSNAIKFTPEGGEIKVSAVRQNNKTLISIKDSGVGMSRADMERLFSEDLSFTTSGTNMEKGTGFGLILVKELVNLNDGDISVKSELNNGSEFIVALPSGKII